LTVTDARGKTTAFQYDALHRLISKAAGNYFGGDSRRPSWASDNNLARLLASDRWRSNRPERPSEPWNLLLKRINGINRLSNLSAAMAQRIAWTVLR
jgi:hypothetical protein